MDTFETDYSNFIGKWFWRTEKDPDGLLKQILAAKYRAVRNGWDIQKYNPVTQDSGVESWQSRSSNKIRLYTWPRDRPLAIQSPHLFLALRTLAP